MPKRVCRKHNWAEKDWAENKSGPKSDLPVLNNLGHLFTYKTGPQNYYKKRFKHDILPSYALLMTAI